MTDLDESWVNEIVGSLPVRITLVVVTALVAAAAAPLVFLANQIFMPVVLKLAAAAVVGLVSGLASRFILKNNSGLLKFLVALVALTSGLLLLNTLTAGYAGLSLSRNIEPNLDGLSQFALAGAASWLALRAWKPAARVKKSPAVKPAKPAPAKKEPRREQPPVKLPPRRRKTQQPKLTRVKPGRYSRKRAPAAKAALPRLAGNKALREQLERVGGSMRRMRPKVEDALVISGRWARDLFDRTRLSLKTRQKARSASVQMRGYKSQRSHSRTPSGQILLKGAEEHRCPYCLEEIKRNDPRGVKICPVCHTYHHADCWAVTGTCQVPHQHE